MKILICEDEEIMLTALAFRMRKQGFEAVIAHNGKEALKAFQEHQPDIIVADIMMPYINGIELLTKLRNEFDNPIPIIMMSTMDNEAIILEAFQKGANDFIAKPFKPNELILRLKKIIQEMKSLVSQ